MKMMQISRLLPALAFACTMGAARSPWHRPLHRPARWPPSPPSSTPPACRRPMCSRPPPRPPRIAPATPVVWSTLRSKTFHTASSKLYGKTKHGAYVCRPTRRPTASTRPRTKFLLKRRGEVAFPWYAYDQRGLCAATKVAKRVPSAAAVSRSPWNIFGRCCIGRALRQGAGEAAQIVQIRTRRRFGIGRQNVEPDPGHAMLHG